MARPSLNRPGWFKITLEELSAYRGVHVPEDHVDKWMAGVLHLWTAPDTRPTMSYLWELLLASQAARKNQLDLTDWSTFRSYELILIAEARISIQMGLETFLPSGLGHLPAEIKKWLYLHVLVLAAAAELAEHPTDPLTDPEVLRSLPPELQALPMEVQAILPAARAAFYYMAGPYAEAEVVRRGVKHVGFHAAKLLLLMEAFRRIGEDSLLAQEATQALETLRKSAWRKTPKEMRLELNGQIPLTLFHRWGQQDALEVLARSLEGELDIAPRAIRDTLVKQAGREAERGEVEVLFCERGEEPPRQWEDVIPSPEWGPEDEARWRELMDRVKSNWRLRQLVLAALEGAETQEELAARCGVDPKTIWNWFSVLKQRLEE